MREKLEPDEGRVQDERRPVAKRWWVREARRRRLGSAVLPPIEDRLPRIGDLIDIADKSRGVHQPEKKELPEKCLADVHVGISRTDQARNNCEAKATDRQHAQSLHRV